MPLAFAIFAALGVITPVPAFDMLGVNVTALNVCPLTWLANVALLVPVAMLPPYVIVCAAAVTVTAF